MLYISVWPVAIRCCCCQQRRLHLTSAVLGICEYGVIGKNGRTQSFVKNFGKSNPKRHTEHFRCFQLLIHWPFGAWLLHSFEPTQNHQYYKIWRRTHFGCFSPGFATTNLLNLVHQQATYIYMIRFLKHCKLHRTVVITQNICLKWTNRTKNLGWQNSLISFPCFRLRFNCVLPRYF